MPRSSRIRSLRRYVAAPTAYAPRGTGEPEGSLLFYATYLYKNGFFYFKAGYASAMAWLLFAATMACTALLLKTSKRWVHYQGGFR